MMQKDIRWKQRFENFEKAFFLLDQSLKLKVPDITQRAGIIQFYEMAFELAWKTLKDYLEEVGGFYDITSPRDVIKKGFQEGILKQGQDWMQALEDRNLTSHTYDETKVEAIELLIRKTYYALLKDTHTFFKEKFSA